MTAPVVEALSRTLSLSPSDNVVLASTFVASDVGVGRGVAVGGTRVGVTVGASVGSGVDVEAGVWVGAG